MKKLAFVAAAALAGACFADGIASANVVGFASKSLVKGQVGTGLNFVNVSGEKMTLNDLKVVGYTGEYMAGQISLVRLGKNGEAVDGKRWTWFDGYDEDEGQMYGWYDRALNKGDTCEIGLGEGVWVHSDKNDTYSIQVAGQVYNQAVAIQLVKGQALCANPLPTATTLNGAIVAGYGESYMAGQISLVKLDANGSAVDGRRWTWFDGEDEDEGTMYGWYDRALIKGDTEALGVGEAVWVHADADDTYTLNFSKITL